MSDNEEPVAFFSKQAKDLFGSNLWRMKDGTEKEVTAIDLPSQYLWPDREVIGLPDRHIKRLSLGSMAFLDDELS